MVWLREYTKIKLDNRKCSFKPVFILAWKNWSNVDLYVNFEKTWNLKNPLHTSSNQICSLSNQINRVLNTILTIMHLDPSGYPYVTLLTTLQSIWPPRPKYSPLLPHGLAINYTDSTSKCPLAQANPWHKEWSEVARYGGLSKWGTIVFWKLHVMRLFDSFLARNFETRHMDTHGWWASLHSSAPTYHTNGNKMIIWATTQGAVLLCS